MLNLIIILQLFYALNTAASPYSEHGINGEHKTDSIAFTRVSRQTKKDPYAIVQAQCNEYSKARYIGPKKNGKPRLNCVTTRPFVVGGIPSRLKEFPHMALIGYNDKNDNINGVDWRCGGTLISDRYILTAAHCFSGENFTPKWVRLGELVIDDDSDRAEPKDYRIAQIIPHPQYKSPSVQHDIMLLRLSEPVTFNSHIRPICLYPYEVTAAAYNDSAIITGWGKTETGEQRSTELLKAKIDFTQNSVCASYYSKDKVHVPNGFDSKTMLCVGDKSGRKDSCEGDSGGPLQVPIPQWLCMYWQVGITSFGPFICGQNGVSSIYTKVSHYIPWIQAIVWP